MTGAGAVIAPVRENLFISDPRHFSALGRCRSCGRASLSVTSGLSRFGQAPEPELAPLSTTGTIYTFTIVRMSPARLSRCGSIRLRDRRLPEGLRVTTTLTAASLEQGCRSATKSASSC